MTSDEAIEWIEKKLPRKFNSYRDLEDFYDDFDILKNSSKLGKDGRRESMQSFMDNWKDGTINPSTTITDVKEVIGTNKVADIEKMDYSKAKKEIDSMKDFGEYPEDIIDKAEESLSRFMDEVREEIDRAFDSEDVGELKQIKTYSPEQETVKQNELYNLITYGDKGIKGLRQAKDIEGLQNLKSEISGLRDEDEIRDNIDQTIEKLRGD